MNEKQFSDRIGNVNDKLIRQAEQIPNYRRGHRRRSIRQLATIAAVIALMVCSFSVGALAFAEKIYVEKSQTSLDKGIQRKTTENELPSLTQCTA